MKIGIGAQIWCVDNHTENFYRMLDDLALLGYDGFETYYPFLIDWYEHRPAELRRLLALHGLELGSYYMGMGFTHDDERKRGVEEFKRRCRFTADVGGGTVLLDGGSKNFADGFASPDDYIRCIADTANELGAFAHAQGLNMAWHQHWGSIFEVETHLHRLLELTDPSVVGFCADVAQLTLSDMDAAAIVKRYAKRITYMHYKDVSPNAIKTGELWAGYPMPNDDGAYNVDSKWRMIELGRGVVDFRAVTDALLDAGYDGYLMDDFDFTSYAAYTSAKACKDFINLGLGVWGERDIREGRGK